MNDERFKKTFLPKSSQKGGEEAALKGFAETNKGNALKTKPKVRLRRIFGPAIREGRGEDHGHCGTVLKHAFVGLLGRSP